VEFRSPLGPGGSFLQETLRWRSRGPWVLAERIHYRQIDGSETLTARQLNPGELSQEYASVIRQLHEAEGLRLFQGDLSQELQPVCVGNQSQLTLTVRDDRLDQTARWVRCTRGTLFDVQPASGAPDVGASRLVAAAQLIRFFTIGEGRLGTYRGSVPFATLDRGPDSPARAPESVAFLSTDGGVPAAFLTFWDQHTPEGTPPPQVDWANEMVFLVSVGERFEAGDVLLVERIVPQGPGQGTAIESVLRVPGDFCSPGERRLHPYHLVVTPSIPPPVEFRNPRIERVACGL